MRVPASDRFGAVAQRVLAVHHHVLNPLRLTTWIVVRCGRSDRVGVENDDVGNRADPQHAAISHPQPPGGPRGQVRDAFLQTENAEFAHVRAEIARKCSPAARMRARADKDAVTAGGMCWVPHDGADVVLVADVYEAADTQPIGHQEVAEQRTRILAASTREFGDGRAHRPR